MRLLAAKLQEQGHRVLRFAQEDNSLIEQARSMIAQSALDEGADVLFWADDDVEFWDADLLIEGALKSHAIVGAPVAIRGGTRVNCPLNGRVEFYLDGGVIATPSIGTGLTAIHRDVFIGVSNQFESQVIVMDDSPPCFPFFDGMLLKMNPRDRLPRWCGEDQSFCIRAKKAGFKVWCDTRVRAKHWTPNGWRVEDVVRGSIEDQKQLAGTWG